MLTQTNEPAQGAVELLELFEEGVVLVDLGGRMRHWNQSFAEMFGYDAEELTSIAFEDLLPDSVRRDHGEWVRRFTEDAGPSRRMSHRPTISGRHRSGHEFPAEAAISRVRIGSELLLVAVLRDMGEMATERRRRAAAERTNRTILDSSKDGLILLDAEGRISHMNLGASRAKTAFASMRPLEVGQLFVADPDAPAAASPSENERRLHGCVWRVLGGETGRAAMDYDVPSARAWLHITVDRAYRMPGALVTIRNVTRERRALEGLSVAKAEAERALAELDRTRAVLVRSEKLEAIGSLSAGIAHEINTPMQYIGDNLRFLLDGVRALLDVATAAEAVVEAGGPSSEREVLAEALDAVGLGAVRQHATSAIADALVGVERVTEIIRALREFAHPRGDELVPTDLNGLVRSSGSLTRGQWKHVARLELDLGEDLDPAWVSPGPISQVLVNLMVNAYQAMADQHRESGRRGTLRISTRRNGDSATIRVADTGTGIPGHLLDRIWEPFFTTKEVGQGTGLGLPIVHQLIERQGGVITVESRPEQGTTFEIVLPVARTRTAAA